MAGSKKIGLFLLGVAYQKFGDKIDQQQEVLAGITDVLIYAYAMESAVLRSRKHGVAADMAGVFVCEAMDWIESAARVVLARCSSGDELRVNLGVLKRFAKYEMVDVVGLRQSIARGLMDAGRYVV